MEAEVKTGALASKYSGHVSSSSGTLVWKGLPVKPPKEHAEPMPQWVFIGFLVWAIEIALLIIERDTHEDGATLSIRVFGAAAMVL